MAFKDHPWRKDSPLNRSTDNVFTENIISYTIKGVDSDFYFIKRIDIQGTYDGAIEGDPKYLSNFIRQDLVPRLKNEYGKHLPFQVIDPGDPALPIARVVLCLISMFPVEKEDDPNSDADCSEMGFCIFCDWPSSIPDFLKFCAPLIDWKGYAKNFDL